MFLKPQQKLIDKPLFHQKMQCQYVAVDVADIARVELITDTVFYNMFDTYSIKCDTLLDFADGATIKICTNDGTEYTYAEYPIFPEAINKIIVETGEEFAEIMPSNPSYEVEKEAILKLTDGKFDSAKALLYDRLSKQRKLSRMLVKSLMSELDFLIDEIGGMRLQRFSGRGE